MNERKLFIINPQVLGVAKAIYKGGAYVNASNSAFLRGLLEDVTNGIKKAVKKWSMRDCTDRSLFAEVAGPAAVGSGGGTVATE